MKLALQKFRQRTVPVLLPVVLTGFIGAILVATIYWTRFDLTWIAFLGGVLFAAVLAMASQASRAEWVVARRTAQLERIRKQLAEEVARSRTATEGMRIADTRLRLLSDALPVLVLFVTRDERLHYHNRAVEEKTGLPAERIEGRPLREVVGNDAYLAIAPHIVLALSGKVADYELAWDSPGSASPVYSARHVPYPPGDPQPHGFYLLLSPLALQSQESEPVPEPAGGPITVSGERGELLYLRTIADDLLGWDDPRVQLERALQENQFLLFAQEIRPLKSDLPDSRCVEILLRLQEEEDNMLPPGGFIPVAERYGMMEDLDRWVVRSVLSWCARKQRADAAWRIPVFGVNLSEAAVISAEFANYVREEVGRSGCPPRSLCFEVEEREVIRHHGRVQRLMAALRPAGCRFTLDAFGSVKPSFSHLKGLKFDFIKVDGVIIQNILRDPSELAKMKAINTVCRKIGTRTIAEFVENDETLEKLRALGTDYAQGFGIARPGPIDQVR
ncbi:MAG: EAL domain-containing protein [Betaproteobacteria bacterium]|nr:EAL domain-containing protein [Betaproteobacteria bacterium]